MARDFHELLRDVPCWDRATEEQFARHGEALQDCALQIRDELAGLCAFIEEHAVRSYLEIGLWTGRTLRALHGIFGFDKLAGCDHGWARQKGLAVEVPPGTALFEGDAGSDAYLRWREALGHVDLVLIDANHAYHAVKADFERERRYPHRFLALHDVTGYRRATAGVRRLWRELTSPSGPGGRAWEIVRPHRELGLPHSTMGIGIWSGSEAPAPRYHPGGAEREEAW